MVAESTVPLTPYMLSPVKTYRMCSPFEIRFLGWDGEAGDEEIRAAGRDVQRTSAERGHPLARWDTDASYQTSQCGGLAKLYDLASALVLYFVLHGMPLRAGSGSSTRSPLDMGTVVQILTWH
jgi:hypothetical protein